METMYPAATFTASRDELLGSDPLLGSAEIARDICRRSDRAISILAITPERMRRVDGWLGPVGFVTHAAAPERSRSLLGSVCDRDRAHDLVRSIIISLVGEIPAVAADDDLEIGDLAALAPGTLPAGIDWLAILSAVNTRIGTAPDRVVVASAGGLVAAQAEAVSGSCRLTPSAPTDLWRRLDDAVGSAPRSIHDLLTDDRPRP